MPGIVGGTRDVQTGPCACTFSSHGALLAGRANEEGRTLLDGLLISVPQGSSSNYVADTRNAQELSFTVSGSMGETETGGPVLNIVPRTGGNNVSGSFFAGVGPQWLQGSNYTQELKDAGLTAATPLIKNYDYSGSGGRSLAQGPPLVLCERQNPGEFTVHLEHLLQQERRQPERVALRSRLTAGKPSAIARGRTSISG